MIIALVGTSVSVGPTTAHPPNSTDHGVNNTTFYRLWAGDHDAFVNDSAYATRTGRSRSATQALANGTDIPLNSPPKAVERWNRGDLQDFPDTNQSVSIHPPNATLTDGVFIKDAYVEIFAVQPSTRARLSGNDHPLYVAPNGSVLGAVDYRVERPSDDAPRGRRAANRTQDHRITEVRVLVDGHVETTSNGSHRPAINYSQLDNYPDETHNLTLEADITVGAGPQGRSAERHCQRAGNNTTCETADNSTGNGTVGVETVTVRDSITVVEYDLTVSGFTARYPNGDLGLVVYKNKPWLGYSLPKGDVRGVWRFYSARDENWDRLVRSTESGNTTTHSPLHPLQVNAYPIETGPTASPRGVVTILATFGVETPPPTLPPDVRLDVLTEPYTASYGIATRAETTDHALSNIRAWGLVRGVEVRAQEDRFARVPFNRSNLTLTILNKTEDTVTVRVQLRDANTGESINTGGRDGYIVLAGERVNTSRNGTVTKTLPRPPGGLSAQYEPGHWWRNSPGYTGDSETVLVQGAVLQVVSTLYRMGVPVSLFLLGVFIIDRFTGWRVWPPWRGL